MKHASIRARAFFSALLIAPVAATALLVAGMALPSPGAIAGPGQLDSPTLSVTSYDNGLSLRWNRVPDAAGYWYTISVGNDIVRSHEIVESPGHPSDPHTVFETVPFGTYTVRVRALNFLGVHDFPEAGPWSNSVVVTVGDDGAPGPVRNLRVSCGDVGFSALYVVTWNSPSQGSTAVKYQVTPVHSRDPDLGSRVVDYGIDVIGVLPGYCSHDSIEVTVRAVDADGDLGPPRTVRFN